MLNRLAEYEREMPTRQFPQTSSTDMQNRARQLYNQASKWILANPSTAVTAAVVTGVMLGWWIKRR